MTKKPSEYAYRHKPRGYREYSLSVLKDTGYFEIYMDAAKYQENFDDILKERDDRHEYFETFEINPANISSIKFPECYLNSEEEGDNDWARYQISKIRTDRKKMGTICRLPVAVITMNNGYNYIFPAEKEAMRKALTISLQIARGTYVPEAKPTKPVAKKSAPAPKSKPAGMEPVV